MICRFDEGLRTLRTLRTLFVYPRIRAGEREFTETVRKVRKVRSPKPHQPMKGRTMRTTDTITSEDLPELRATLVGFADTAGFSAALRLACRDAVAAIDRALAMVMARGKY